MKRYFLLTCAFLVSWAPLHAQQQASADLVILRAHVWTVDHAHPAAQALAISGNRIAAVGSDDEIKKWIGPATRQIDAQNNSVLPGFIDAHVHFSSGGSEISGVHLRDAATPKEFARRIAKHAKTLPKGEWMAGGTWDHELWGGTPLPSHDWIDAGTPDTPVFVTRYDGHMALANALALRLEILPAAQSSATPTVIPQAS